MINYLTSFVNTDGVSFPNTRSVNASGPSATDGTEFVKLMIDDYWGRFQALLDRAGLSPDGVTEAPGTSQHIESIKKGFAVGPGMGVIYWKDADPGVSGDRVLLLNGQGVLVASFAELDAAVYVGDTANPTASKFYHADDAGGTIRNIAGIFLILPDMRGYVLRGLDVGAGVDPDGVGRDVGSTQLDSFQGHYHETYATNFADQGGTVGTADKALWAATTGAFTTLIQDPGGTRMVRESVTDGVSGAPRTAIESRMVNVATRFGITF